VEDIAGVKLERRYNLSAPKGVNGRNSDNTLTRKVLGWEPSTSLRDGLELTYRWIYDEISAKRPLEMGPATAVKSTRRLKETVLR
jgi:GDP-D-mannose 3', 5'-epimerase